MEAERSIATVGIPGALIVAVHITVIFHCPLIVINYARERSAKEPRNTVLKRQLPPADPPAVPNQPHRGSAHAN